jgi:2-keto-3-deoxy-6-phosphogluconate aldolase
MDIKHTVNTLLRDGFILVFNQDKLDIVKTAQALINAGLNNMEVTCRISRPQKKIEKLCGTIPDFVVGAASLIDFPPMLNLYNEACSSDPLPSVEQVIDASVSYIVSAANFSDKSYTRYARRIAMIPGCGSVTEIVDQFSKGANLCKIFPAKQLGGPSFVKAIDPAIHKTISLVPTGGTNADNIPDYIDAGVLVLGGSFSMVEKSIMKEIIERQDYDLLTEQLIGIKQLIDEKRSVKWPDIDFTGASVEQIAEITGRNFNL